jgi:GNAT superfamily N-acetyltransferase
MVPTTLIPVLPPTHVSRFTVRALESGDFRNLQRLEQELWSQDSAGRLCTFYLRLCTEHYPDWCFLAFEGDRPVGYALNFPRGKVNYCATLAVHPDFRKDKVSHLLIRAMVIKLLREDMEECRFLVEPGNRKALSIHESLGARVVGEVYDYSREGDTRLWSAITRNDFERIRAKYTRLRLVS